MTVTTRG